MDEPRTTVVGIDLGTTHSVIAYLDKNGRPTTIRNSEGDITTPSVVLFEDSTTVVGKEAARTAPFEPQRIAQFAKRDVGSAYYEKTICGEHLPPEVIEALILRKLKQDAEMTLGAVRDAVITVPAYFNEPRRKATQDAGKLAGLNVLDIINEPTAAAIAYGVHRDSVATDAAEQTAETVLVYDLGGGTFDATLMELDGAQYRAVATAGDVCLGGMDWDERIIDHVADEFVRQFDTDPREHDSAREKLRQESEVAKKALTARSSYKLNFEFADNRLQLDLSRETFEQLTLDLLERTLFTVRKLLKDAERTWGDVTRLLVVGGSTRMPMIIEALETESGFTVDRSVSPDEAVAQGAAIYADLLSRTAQGEPAALVVENVSSHDLGVLAVEATTGLPRRQVLIPRNTPLPAGGSARFATRDEDQRTVVVNVIEGGDASGRNATRIGSCIVSELPAELPAKTPVEVRFTYLENGRLKVVAWLPSSDSQATLTIERAAGLSDDVVTEWQEWIASGAILSPMLPEDDTVLDTVALDGEHDFVEDLAASENSGVFVDEFEAENPAADGEADAAADAAAEPDPDLDDFLRGLP